MWRPPLSTFPGHHVTFGLRISRALVRMNKNVTRNAVSTRNAVLRPGTVVSGNGSTLTMAASIAGQPRTPRDRPASDTPPDVVGRRASPRLGVAPARPGLTPGRYPRQR